MAYPGVFMIDDAHHFKDMRQAAKHSGLICMHAENGGAIELSSAAIAGRTGKRAPNYHALTDPPPRGRRPLPRNRPFAEWPALCLNVHLSCNEALEKVREARARGITDYAENCPQY